MVVIENNIYKNAGYIFKAGYNGKGYNGYLYNGNQFSTNISNESWLSEDGNAIEPTDEERLHFLACEKAGHFIPLSEINKIHEIW